MAQTVRMPDGTIQTFPDSATPEQIQAAIAGMGKPSMPTVEGARPVQSNPIAAAAGRVLGAPVDLAANVLKAAGVISKETVPAFGSERIEDFLDATNVGLRAVGAGVGLNEPPEPIADPNLATQAGEIFGEAAPFLPAGIGVGAVKSLAGRIALSGLLGGAEGGVLARGKGATDEEALQAAGFGGGLAATLEAAFPIVGRVANRIYRGIRGTAPSGALIDAAGEPTEEFIKVLDEANLSIDDFSQQARQAVADGLDPAEVERLARFRRQDVPITSGILSQDDVLLGRERTLIQRTDEAAMRGAAPLREQYKNINQALDRNATQLIEEIGGLPDEVGESVKDALAGRKKLLQTQKNKLYQQAAEASPELVNVPIVADTLKEAIPDDAQLRRLSRLRPTEINALQDLLVEFGIDKDLQRMDAFLTGRNEITPLSFSNFEDFRQALNQISRADQTGTTAVAVRPIIDALDNELDTAFKAMEETADRTTLDILKDARGVVREMKVEYDPKGLVDKLIASQKGSTLPKTETSQVFNSIMRSPPEAVGRVIRNLSDAPGGKKAIRDLQASTIMRALDDALKATTGKGEFNPTAFVNSLNRMNAKGDVLEKIFSDSPQILSELRDLERTARDVVTPGSTMPKGSAPFVAALLDRIPLVRSVPQVQGFIDVAEVMNTTKGALKATPRQQATVEYVAREYPSLAAALAVPLTVESEKDGE